MSEEKLSIRAMQEYYFDKAYEFVCDIVYCGQEITETNGPSPAQRKVLDAVSQSARDRRPVACKSGHGTGKTCVASWIIYWFLFTHPFGKVGVTAPTERQLKNGLWAELQKWLNRSVILQSFFKWKTETVEVRGQGIAWAAELRTSYKPENLAGLHGEGGCLMVVDEASGILDDNIWDTMSGAMSDVGSFMLAIGNPTQVRGAFHRFFVGKGSQARKLTLSCLDPGYHGSPSFAKEIEAKYGRDSDQYRVRVLGEFPLDSPTSFIKLAMLQGAYARPFSQSLLPIIAVDPADAGDDATEIFAGVGYRIAYQRTLNGETDGCINGQAVLMMIHKLRENCKKLGFHPDVTIEVVFDRTGIGAGMDTYLKPFQTSDNFKLIPIHAAEAGNDEYEDMSDLLWGNMKSLLHKLSIPHFSEGRASQNEGFTEEFFEELEDQICGRNYEINPRNNKIKLESKKTMKARGKCSPNKADTLALYLSRFMRDGVDKRGESGRNYSVRVSL